MNSFQQEFFCQKSKVENWSKRDAESFEDICRFRYPMVKSELIFNPTKREEIWRFFSYQFLHAGFQHIFGNMLFQLVFGIPLEMVHGSLRKVVENLDFLKIETSVTTQKNRSYLHYGRANGITIFVNCKCQNLLTWRFGRRLLPYLCSTGQLHYEPRWYDLLRVAG